MPEYTVDFHIGNYRIQTDIQWVLWQVGITKFSGVFQMDVGPWFVRISTDGLD